MSPVVGQPSTHPTYVVLFVRCHSSLLNSVAANVKDAIKAYEQTTSLPYDDVPPELCRASAGTNTIDLSSWSLLVNDAALRRIAAEDRDRIDMLARQSSVNQVRCTRHHAERREDLCFSRSMQF